MKNKISTARKFIFAALFVFALAIAAAQTVAFRVGDNVQTPDGQIGIIESFKDRLAKVKFGNGANDFQYLVVEDLVKIKIAPPTPKSEAQEREEAKQRQIFRVEAGKYFCTVYLFEQFYKPKFSDVKGGIDAKVIKQAEVNLAELDALCKSKYQGITNESEPAYQTSVRYRSADWCGMAAQREEILKTAGSGTQNAVGDQFIERWKRSIEQSSKGSVSDEVQAMLFDRAKWKARDLPNLRRMYEENGGTVPDSIFDAVKPELDKLRLKIKNDSKTISWRVPPYKDAVIEAFIKNKYAASPKFKGIVIVKSGLDFQKGS